MFALVSLLLILSLSFLAVRIGAIALTMTGLSDEIAKFQALSAFSGTGFTTAEAESVVNGPARRRIIAWLIRAGSAGIVTAISTLMLSFVGGGVPTLAKLALLGAGTALIVMIARSRRLDQVTRPVIERFLRESSTLELRDYAGLLHLREDWRVGEIEIGHDSWFLEAQLGDLGLAHEGVSVLGIHCKSGEYVGVPSAETRLEPGDTVLLYGRGERLCELRMRRMGDEAAARAARREAEARGEVKDEEL